MGRRCAACVALALMVLTSCRGETTPDDGSAAASPGPTVTSTSAGTAPTTTASARPARRPADPRWRFFTDDRARYASPWFPGRHRVMIGYGCTDAPYYVPDPRCDGRGFHHGVDVALPCGTPLLSGVSGQVVRAGAGAVGPAYGRRPLLLRTSLRGSPVDVLVGHARQLLVEPGTRVSRGDRIAITGASGAPDGCHLHLEVRAAGGDVTTARDPAPVLALRSAAG